MADDRYSCAIVWLRRDLRLRDNVALAAAAAQSRRIVLAFVVDPEVLRSGRVGSPIVQTFFEAVSSLRNQLRERGSELAVLHGEPAEELVRLARQLQAGAVFYNEDYEPSAIARDRRVEKTLREEGIEVHAYLDHVCLAADDVRTEAGAPYRVYTPYARRWRDNYALSPPLPVDSIRALDGRLLSGAQIGATSENPRPEAFGFTTSPNYPHCSEEHATTIVKRFVQRGGGVDRYAKLRDIPACDGTSHLSVQLRAGTIGIRTVFAEAYRAAGDPARRASVEKWISELIWREFFQMILKCFPHVEKTAFVPAGERVAWENDDRMFAAWCEGRTGYPIVDAAMRQLNTTGWMHNRLRMIVASFLTKDLLIDWRWGERYFETHLADGDLAQNNGGWQWAASTGADASPYFRIFNPVLQSKKFDPDGTFIRSMIPELRDVPAAAIHEPSKPIVDHRAARERALAAYATLRT